MKKLIGPFSQMLPLTGLALKGALPDEQLQVITHAGILVEDDCILDTGNFEQLRSDNPEVVIEEITGPSVLLPGFIDCHTHICFAGSRAGDYAMRLQGMTYLDITRAGGGIWDTVTRTRSADESTLLQLLQPRILSHLSEGVTTIEIKSGYGLDITNELKQLRVIQMAAVLSPVDLVTTCLAAHMLPPDFPGSADEYLDRVVEELLPVVQKERLAHRVDIFIEDGAFHPSQAVTYLSVARQMGFDLTVHAGQFTACGIETAVTAGALSADHLEAATEKGIKLLAASGTAAVVLPGASMGLGMAYGPARKLLNAGACLVIASDWNPGSAPMGHLLLQAAVMGASEKLTTAEVFAGLTFRAAHALRLEDRGRLIPGMLADMQAYPCAGYREILYHQGKLRPVRMWKKGNQVYSTNRT
jgi:imidazolonepropionase